MKVHDDVLLDVQDDIRSGDFLKTCERHGDRVCSDARRRECVAAVYRRSGRQRQPSPFLYGADDRASNGRIRNVGHDTADCSSIDLRIQKHRRNGREEQETKGKFCAVHGIF